MVLSGVIVPVLYVLHPICSEKSSTRHMLRKKPQSRDKVTGIERGKPQHLMPVECPEGLGKIAWHSQCT